ncbi:beta-N-acetylglucosaminidase domain-containing protein [Lentibacillus sp. CBA3610]|uniref:beta-N-acetylhexosaminidase family protein n=1 Tax=Lentibacillus sp. CBA3610 TaxID=2518176 RepID=UPI0015958E06|nr:beta-N-acetylglucosaminidase domain-containing protein [Lentibacillus sp. CBA3610]QKY69353.1 beta-N-acetylhexosaminidase [Lentibacillus sp. CBA3610]
MSYWKRVLMLTSILLLCVPVMSNMDKASASVEGELNINPKPQEIDKTSKGFPLPPKVGIVSGEETDEKAVDEVIRVLKEADVKKIIQKKPDEKVNASMIIFIGSPSFNGDVANALEEHGSQSPETLEDEGYVISSQKKHKQVVLAGKDATGTYYAAKTFSQLIEERPGRDWVPQVNIRDWPEMPIRGSIEGFYGPPWTHEDRLNQLAFYGENKMNTYIYAPKDDPYHRENWREPYPEEELTRIQKLVEEAEDNHVNFTFSISPGQSICYSGDEDFELLKQKMEQVWDLGVRSYAIFLDDISKNLHCEEDRKKFGSQETPTAAAHAYLLNRFSEEFIQTHDGAERLITVPTDYSGNGTTDYREEFADSLDGDTVVMWTGPKVVSEEITSEGTKKVWEIFQHDLLLWDNYPVNDFDRNSLFLGPLVNRDADLTEHGVIGLTSNPMNEAEASKIPLYTIADYTWNPADYDPQQSWEHSIQAFGGDAADTLKKFAENSYSSPLNEKESLTLTPLIEDFWEAIVSGDAEDEANTLKAEFKNLQDVPYELQQELSNKKFLVETEPYMEKLESYGKAGEAAVNYLMAQKGGKSDKANQYREELITIFNESEKIPQKMGEGVIKPFLIKSVLMLPPLHLSLQPQIDTFWEHYDDSENNQAAEKLTASFENLQAVSENARETIENEAFIEAAEPYLNNLDIYGEAGEVAVAYLMAKKNNESDEAAMHQSQLKELMVQAYKQPQMVGEQVIKPFLIDSMWDNLNVIEYRELDGVNTYRGAGELIQYTPDHGDSTGSNQWGYEVVVADNTVSKRGGNDSAIPDNGYVLSIHANDWLRDYALLGRTIQIEDGIVLIIK